jgi:uncharacterized membrane protein YqjE
MLIGESASRLAASLLSIFQTRLELAASEVEEESLRYFSCLMLSLAAMFCLGVAIVLAVLLAVVLYWETHRIGILLSLIGLFGFAGVLLWLRVRKAHQAKPRLMKHSSAELSRDIDMLQPRP